MLCIGADGEYEAELGDARLLCAEGVAEAEALGDAETQAALLHQGALLDTVRAAPASHTVELLQVCVCVRVCVRVLGVVCVYVRVHYVCVCA